MKPGRFFWVKIIFFLILAAALPITIWTATHKTPRAPKATAQISTLFVSPGFIHALPGGTQHELSAQAFDTGGTAINTGVSYQWGMSSTNSIGNLIPNAGNDKLAVFVPSPINVGIGDIWVKAYGANDQIVTKSIPVYIGVTPPTPSTTSIPTPTPGQPPASECAVCTTNMNCAPGLICQYVPTPTPNCPYGPNGPCSVPQNFPYQACVKPDGSSHCPPIPPPPPLSTPTPTPSIGCYYQQVQCFQAPCPPILICPTITPTWTGTPTPTLSCGRGTPTVRLTPNNQSGNPGQTLTYTATITNTDTQGCSPSLFALSTQVDINFTAQHVPTLNIPALGTANIGVTVTSPAVNPYPETRSLPITLRATNTSTNLSASANAAYTLIKPAPQPLKFLVRLAGVNGSEAQGATINVKLKLKDGTVLSLDKPLVLNPIGNGVYSATATLTNPLPMGTSLRVLVKGEKHSQVEFCRPSGQTDTCNDTEYIPSSTDSFDFTGRPLPPGDLNQDGRVNSTDLALITDLFKKPSSQQTPQDLKIADVNYSGKVDSLDLSLVFQTLETRYDEQ